MAITDISTATTPATPMTMTSDVPSRCGTLRRFMAVTTPIWVIMLMGSSPQRRASASTIFRRPAFKAGGRAATTARITASARALQRSPSPAAS